MTKKLKKTEPILDDVNDSMLFWSNDTTELNLPIVSHLMSDILSLET